MEILRDFERMPSPSSREGLWKELDGGLYSERPLWSIVALSTLSGEPEAEEKVFNWKGFERIREIVREEKFGFDARNQALEWLLKFGLKERDLEGNLKTYDTLYNLMMSLGEDIFLRKYAGYGLISLDAEWLTLHIQEPEIIEYFKEMREKIKTSPLLEEARMRWEETMEGTAPSKERFISALLMAISETGSAFFLEKIASLISAPQLQGKDREAALVGRWLPIVLRRLEDLKKRLFPAG